MLFIIALMNNKRFLWEAWQVLNLIILIIAAVLSLALGIKTEVVLDAHNGVISTMKLGANWVDMHLLEWMYVLNGVRKIWKEGWGVLYREVHEERMHHLFFNDTSFSLGLGLLVGKWHFSIYLLLEDN
nr:calcium-transporting atpase 9, plasma membrane-type [Quercus suber]